MFANLLLCMIVLLLFWIGATFVQFNNNIVKATDNIEKFLIAFYKQREKERES
jgi:outer membrane lipoprotein-sorting protein